MWFERWLWAFTLTEHTFGFCVLFLFCFELMFCASPVLFVLSFVYWNVFYCCVLTAQTWLDLTWLDPMGSYATGRRCDPQWSLHSPDLNPQILSVGALRTGCMATTPDYPWPEGSNYSSNKSDTKGGMREGQRELCPPDPNVPAAPGSAFGAHFLSASETKSFCSTDLKLWRCLLHRLDLM